MKLQCKICCVAVGVGVLSLAGYGAWAWRERPQPIVNEPEKVVNPHASAERVLAGALERLHQEALAHFYADPKNGYARMPPVFEKVVKEWKTPWFSSGELDQQVEIPFSKDMQQIHDGAVKDFLSPRTLKPNAERPSLAVLYADEKKYNREKKIWEAKSVDLIGLIKHETPVVYVSEKAADLHAAGEVPTRPLDEFELAGLHKLAKGEDHFGRTRDGVIRLLGSVRAETSCLRCHEDKMAGDLLGAFSYVLREAEYQRTAFGAKRPPGPVDHNPQPPADR